MLFRSPQDNPNRLSVESAAILGAIKRASIFSSKSTNLVVLNINDKKKHSLNITAQDIDFSTSAEEEVPCICEADRVMIGVRYAYIIEMIQQLDAERILITFSGPSTAILIMSEDDSISTYLLMPMTIY